MHEPKLVEIQVWLKRHWRFSLLMSFLRESGKAGLRVCLTHGRGELRRSRKKRKRMALKIWTEHKPYLNFRSARLW